MNIDNIICYPYTQIQKELGEQIHNSVWLQVYRNVERPLWNMLMDVNRSIDNNITELDNGEQDNV